MDNVNKDQEWLEEDSDTFIDYGHYFVPEREYQINIICQLIKLRNVKSIAELSFGKGVLTKKIFETFPHIKIYGYEKSLRMIEEAKQYLKDYNSRFQTFEFEIKEHSWRNFPHEVDCLLSSLAIHHLNDNQKKELYEQMFAEINPGGMILIADLIEPTTEAGRLVAAKDWDREVAYRSLQTDNNLNAFEHFNKIHWNYYSDPEPDPVDTPSSLFNNLKWLDEAGFKDVDVFWMKAGHAIYAGFK